MKPDILEAYVERVYAYAIKRTFDRAEKSSDELIYLYAAMAFNYLCRRYCNCRILI